MSPSSTSAPLPETLTRLVEQRQLTVSDAHRFLAQPGLPAGPAGPEAAVLRWLAGEYGVAFNELSAIAPERDLLAAFPARLLVRDELLPLRRLPDGSVEVATARLFATAAFDGLRSVTGLRLRPVLAPSDALRRELKERLGVGADTLGILGDEAGLQVVDELAFGPDYAETLRRWRESFTQSLEQVRMLGFDERFIRLWTFYLAYCEAAFDEGNIDVVQFTLVRV